MKTVARMARNQRAVEAETLNEPRPQPPEPKSNAMSPIGSDEPATPDRSVRQESHERGLRDALSQSDW